MSPSDVLTVMGRSPLEVLILTSLVSCRISTVPCSRCRPSVRTAVCILLRWPVRIDRRVRCKGLGSAECRALALRRLTILCVSVSRNPWQPLKLSPRYSWAMAVLEDRSVWVSRVEAIIDVYPILPRT